MYKKIIAIILTAIMFMNIRSVEISKAAEVGQVSTERMNYNFIETLDHGNIHYTYEENGKTYCVYESINNSFTECSTRIYLVDEEVEVLVEEFTTYVGTDDGIISEGVVLDEKSMAIDGSSNVFSSGRPYDGMIYYEARTNRYFTGWYYDHSSSGSTVFARLTYAVVAATLANAVGVDLISDAIKEYAENVIEQKIPKVYWDKDVYLVNQIRYPERTIYGSFVGQRTYVYFYSDSARTIYLGSETGEWHDTEEWPLLTIGPA